MRVLLADHHTIVRQAVKSVLEEEGFEVVGEASDGRQAVNRCRFLKPEVAVLDLWMPRLNGVEAAREIRRICPCTQVVILMTHMADRYVLERIQSGIKGYVLKADAATELVDALHAIAKCETHIVRSS